MHGAATAVLCLHGVPTHPELPARSMGLSSCWPLRVPTHRRIDVGLSGNRLTQTDPLPAPRVPGRGHAAGVAATSCFAHAPFLIATTMRTPHPYMSQR